MSNATSTLARGSKIGAAITVAGVGGLWIVLEVWKTGAWERWVSRRRPGSSVEEAPRAPEVPVLPQEAPALEGSEPVLDDDMSVQPDAGRPQQPEPQANANTLAEEAARLEAAAQEFAAAAEARRNRGRGPAKLPVIPGTIRVFMFPMCGVASLWVLASSYSEHLRQLLPRIRLPGIDWARARRFFRKRMPTAPRGMVEAFDVGGLVTQLRSAVPSSSEERDLLEAISTTIGRKLPRDAVLTRAEVEGMRGVVVTQADRFRRLKAARGVFKLVNVMWFAGLSGLVVSTIPLIALLVKIARRKGLFRWIGRYSRRLRDVLTRAFEFFRFRVLRPAFNYGIIEVLMHFGVVCLHAYAHEMEHGAVHMATVPAILLYVCSCGVSAVSIDAPSIRAVERTITKNYILRSLFFTIPSMYLIPLAVAHNSKFYGLLSAVVGLAHFQNVILQPLASVAKIPRYSGTALRWQLSTAAYIATFCGLRASPLHERWIRPFEFGASWICGGTFFAISLLSASASFNTTRRTRLRRRRRPAPQPKHAVDSYAFRNAVAVAGFVAGAAAGKLGRMPGLLNVSLTAGVLWGLQKLTEVRLLGLPWQLGLFTSSAAGYYVALWLRSHPEFLVPAKSLLKRADK